VIDCCCNQMEGDLACKDFGYEFNGDLSSTDSSGRGQLPRLH
jgi:hypothetical protein